MFKEETTAVKFKDSESGKFDVKFSQLCFNCLKHLLFDMLELLDKEVLCDAH